MNLLCKLALVAIPYNLISIAWVQLDLLHHASPDNVRNHFGNTTLLIIAHPDDETMFFGPLILNLLNENKHLHILCLSRGNAEEEGHKRKDELAKVVTALGSKASLSIINDNRLKDGFSNEWDQDVIVKYVQDQIHALNNTGLRSIVTFDSYGISGHPNHRSVHEAIYRYKKLNSTLISLEFFILRSVSLYRKYISFLDAIITYPPKLRTTYRSQAYFAGDNVDMILALDFNQNARLRQLLNMHESQMVWFRKLYMFLSRNMFLNNLSQLE